MKTRTKLIFGFATIVTLLWMIVAYAAGNLSYLSRQFSTVEEEIIPDTIAMTEVEKLSSEIYRDVTEYVFRDNPPYDIQEARDTALQKLSRLEEIGLEYLPAATVPGSIEHGKDSVLAGKIFDFYYSTISIIELKENGADYSTLLSSDRSTCLPALLAVQERAGELKAASTGDLTTVKTAFDRAYSSGIQSLISSAGLITLLALAAALFTTRSIVHPLHALREGTEMIAQGNLDYKVGTDARDEIGELSRDFDQMTKSLSTSMTSIDNLNQQIAERKKMEAKLQSQNQLIEHILATLPEGVLVIDGDDRVILANEAFHRIFLNGKKPVTGRILHEIIPANQLVNLYRAVKQGNNEKNTLEFRYQVKDQKKIIVCVINKMDGGRTLLTFIDVSQEREEEEKLYLTDRLASIGEMAAGLAHELNNPLTGVLALSQLLVDSDIPEEYRDDLQCVNNEAKRAANIVKNVLLFARSNNYENGQASTNDVIKDVLRLREYEEKVNNITATADLAENLPDISMDKFQLQQVFLNIILNAEAAIKEAGRPGILKVSTERVNNHVNIHIKDNGCGIKKNILPRIFDPFFTTKEIGKGTGLGLSICYGIVVKHGGKIGVKTQVNKGTTFTIKMPVMTQTAEERT